MTFRATTRRLTLLALTTALAGCPAPGKPVVPGDETALARGRAVVRAGARTLAIRTPDGRSLAGATILVGGKAIVLRDGPLDLGDLPAKGRAVLIVPGFAPVSIALDADREVVLEPIALAPGTRLEAGGGTATAPGVAVAIAPGRLPKAGTEVRLGSYVPLPPFGDDASATRERDAFVAAVAAAGGPGAGAGADCDRPVPCPPPTAALGLVVYVDGPLGPGALPVTYDLAALRGGPQGPAAAKLLAAFAAMDAAGGAPYRTVLARDHGVTLAGERLTFQAPLPDGVAAGQGATVQIAAFRLLGVALEVTVVSAPGGSLPGPAQPGASAGPIGLASPGGPGALPSGLGGPGGPGGTLIGDQGGGIISDGGLGIIANNAGSLVGQVRVPFLADPSAKRRLLAYTDYPYEDVMVTAMNSAGRPYLPAVPTDATGRYTFTDLPDTPPMIYLEGVWGGYRVLGAGKAPGSGVSTADLDAATTGIASWMLDEVRAGSVRPELARHAGYLADVAAVRPLLSQADAEYLCSHDVAADATFMRAFYASRGLVPAWRKPFATFAIGSTPHGVALDAQGRAWVVNRGDNTVSRVSDDGTVLGPFPVGGSPLDVAVAPSGDLWVSNTASANVTLLRPDGVVKGTFAVGGQPHQIVFDAEGAAWVPNSNDGTVSRLAPNGSPLGTYPIGGGTWGMAVDPAGAMWITATAGDFVAKLAPDGTLSNQATVEMPRGLAFDRDGNAWVASQDPGKVVKVSATGQVLGTFAVDAGPRCVAVAPDGDVWVACRDGNSLVELGPDGARKRTVTTGPQPFDLAIDAQGRVWFTTEGDATLGLLTP